MKLKTLWQNRPKKLFVILELNNNYEVEGEFYFKTRINRERAYKHLMFIECESHYSAWCDVHEYEMCEESLDEYLSVVPISNDKYVFLNGVVSASDARYKDHSYEAMIEKAKLESKDEKTK